MYAIIARLEELGILREVTGRQRNKLYVYDEYLALLNEGTTDPPSWNARRVRNGRSQVARRRGTGRANAPFSKSDATF